MTIQSTAKVGKPKNNMTISEQIAKLENDLEALKYLSGSILATLKINLLRGTITTNPESGNKELKELLDSWSKRYNEIVPPIPSTQLAAITADALSDWEPK